jgi:hypothetical protein
LSRNERGRFGALKSDSTHHFFRNACTKSGSLRFSQFSYGVEKTVDTHKILINAITFYVCLQEIRTITKLPNSEQSNKGKVKTHKYINTKSVNNRKTVKTVMSERLMADDPKTILKIVLRHILGQILGYFQEHGPAA